MNANFKPLGLAAAVATATAGYTGVVNATAELASNAQLGDLAIVPYYTVQAGYATGLSIINTSDVTQVIKIRMRRASDSMDAMDWNVVLSPEDVYTGTIAAKGENIVFVSNDNSCTAPEMPAGGFEMYFLYREGAEEGYVEVISMGSPIDEDQPIAEDALHGSDGIPANCDNVRDNFFVGGEEGESKGNVNSVTTVQYHYDESAERDTLQTNTYEASPDSLKVSYFIKSDETGVEFGNNAVHISGHMDGASMTNQEQGVFAGDLQGFDHPDLNGGAPLSVLQQVPGAATRGLYEDVRNAIGADALINDWSANQNGPFTVDTDWVVTTPGQYLMMDLPQYLQVLNPLNPDAECLAGPTSLVGWVPSGDPTADFGKYATCDFRDIPLRADFSVWDREEQGIVVDPGDLVVSPKIPGESAVVELDQEVNVIQWGESPVLNAAKVINVPVPEGADFGWSNLKVTQDAGTATYPKTQAICDFAVLGGTPSDPLIGIACDETDTPVPLVGFVAWQRNFVELAAANYGRIVEHSRVITSS